MSAARRYREAVERVAADLGYILTRTRKGHCRWVHQEVPHPVFTPGTPSCRDGHIERQKLERALRLARKAGAKS